MSTLTLEAPVVTEVETPIHAPYHTTAALTLEDQMVRQQAHVATKARFQQVVFAGRFALIARQVRKGNLAPQATLDAVQQLVASVA